MQADYARRTGLPLRSLPNYRGTAVGWQNRLIRDGSAFVVELHAGPAPAKRTPTRCSRWRGDTRGDARARPPRRDRVERVRAAHVAHRHPAHRGRARGGSQLAGRLAGREFALVLSSPRVRARETAALAGFEPEIDPDLVEVDYGDYEGRTTPEIREERPGWTLWRDGSPGGETLAAGRRSASTA